MREKERTEAHAKSPVGGQRTIVGSNPPLTFCLKQTLLLFTAMYAWLSGPQNFNDSPPSIYFATRMLDLELIYISPLKFIVKLFLVSNSHSPSCLTQT